MMGDGFKMHHRNEVIKLNSKAIDKDSSLLKLDPDTIPQAFIRDDEIVCD